MKDIISVIVPVYNIKDYITECVMSIISQSYKNLEIILVDDGSSDGSGELCDKLSERDTRIQVLHKQNGGLSSARNAGLRVCTGEYISFIDGDDEIEENMYELMTMDLNKESADIVICGCKIIESNRTILRNGTNDCQIWGRNEALSQLLTGKIIEPSVCDKLYRREILKDTFFNEQIRLDEDLPYNYQIFKKCHKVVFHDLCLYKYKQRNGSLTHTVFNQKNVEILKHIEKLFDSICNEVPEIERYGVYRYVMTLVSVYNHSYDSNGYDSLREEIREKLQNIEKNIYYNDLSLSYKLALYMINRKLPFYKLILQLRLVLRRMR